MTDEANATIQAAARGDAEAWRQLLQTYSSRVYGLLYRRCGDGELAEEITQATFVKVLKKIEAYEEQGKFEAWLFRIALNQLRDEMRRRKRQAATVDFTSTPPAALGHTDNSPTPYQHQEQAEQARQVQEAVQKLPEADQEMIYLRYTAQLSYAQIAETLDQPLGTVLARGHRVLKKLRDLLGETQESKRSRR